MTTTGASPLFVDTNILIYSVNTASVWHSLALNALQTARNSGVELVISPQILRKEQRIAELMLEIKQALAGVNR